MLFSSCCAAGRSKPCPFGVCNFKRFHKLNSASQNFTHISNPVQDRSHPHHLHTCVCQGDTTALVPAAVPARTVSPPGPPASELASLAASHLEFLPEMDRTPQQVSGADKREAPSQFPGNFYFLKRKEGRDGGTPLTPRPAHEVGAQRMHKQQRRPSRSRAGVRLSLSRRHRSRALASTWRPRPGNPAASMAALAQSPRGGAGGSSARARTYPHRCRPAPRPPPLLTSPRAAAVPGAGPCLAPPQLGRAGTATPLPPAPPGPAAVPSAAALPSYEPPSPGPPVPPGHGRAELRHCRARPRGGLSRSGRALRRPQAGRGHNSP